MPFLEIQSQGPWPAADATSAFLGRLSRLVATALGKPASIMMVSAVRAEAMHFAESSEPCCYISLRSIGEVSSATMNSICQAVSEEVLSSLSIPASRVFIVFDEVRRSHWGVRGRMLE